MFCQLFVLQLPIPLLRLFTLLQFLSFLLFCKNYFLFYSRRHLVFKLIFSLQFPQLFFSEFFTRTKHSNTVLFKAHEFLEELNIRRLFIKWHPELGKYFTRAIRIHRRVPRYVSRRNARHRKHPQNFSSSPPASARISPQPGLDTRYSWLPSARALATRIFAYTQLYLFTNEPILKSAIMFIRYSNPYKISPFLKTTKYPWM